MAGIAIAVSPSATHTFGKQVQESIRLNAGRQVHLIHSELHDELNASAFSTPVLLSCSARCSCWFTGDLYLATALAAFVCERTAKRFS